ncbi:hypothetical protein E6C27_scaffold133G00630 [Cucumis melo var. makuwa]|uniref:Uncharacterized protein n=1 Tax=Cucumis melo var. makuwa TaxID=1194695 RepID=A0A5A7U2N5_CUCMM|nr:hypothetical protein E6C27_scaffold133G00630 [Cucumis melo var. makuwa]
MTTRDEGANPSGLCDLGSLSLISMIRFYEEPTAPLPFIHFSSVQHTQPPSIPTFSFVQPIAFACLRFHLYGSLFVSVVGSFATSTCNHAVAYLTFSLLLALPAADSSIDIRIKRGTYWLGYLSFLEGVRKVALEFLGFTVGLVGDSPPFLKWIRLDVELNKDFSNILGTVSFRITRLICVSFGITRLICASFGITRLICASFEITRLICVSFGSLD